MAIGDQTDFLARLKSTLPARWFSSTTPGNDSETPVLDGVLSGPAWILSWLYDLLEWVAAQRRINTASGLTLDLIARDFFGHLTQRLIGESDDSYRARIKATLFGPRATRQAIIDVLTVLTGHTPTVFEPRNPIDTGGWGSNPMPGGLGTGLAYGLAGGYGSLILPFQAFVKAYRPVGTGIANVEGYYGLGSGLSAAGGYGVGALEYVGKSMIPAGVTDDVIYETIAETAPIATILWTAITNINSAGGVSAPPPSILLARLVEKVADQTISAALFTGSFSATLNETQANQLISAALSFGTNTATLSLAQASQTLTSTSLLPTVWNLLDKTSNIILSNNNKTANSAVATGTSDQTGSQTVGTTGPVITAPVGIAVIAGSSYAITGLSVTDTIWPTTGSCVVNVTASGGTVAMTVGGTQVSGSGAASVSYNGTDANVQAALASLTFTAGASAGPGSLAISVVDQHGAQTSVGVGVTINSIAYGAVRSTNATTATKWYAELTTSTGSNNEIWGIANTSWDETNQGGLGGGGNSNSVGWWYTGQVYLNDNQIGTIDAIGPGSIMGIAVDTVSKKLWVRVNGGSWGSVSPGVIGAQTVGTAGSGPVIVGPGSAVMPISTTGPIPGVSVSDNSFTATSTASLVVTASLGTVGMTLNGSAVTGSGSRLISISDTSANIIAALSTLSYTGLATAGADTVTVKVTDQFNQSQTLTIPVTIVTAADPGLAAGGMSLAGLTFGPLMLAYATYTQPGITTLNGGDTAFAYPIPTGFTPFGLLPATTGVGIYTSNETTTSITLTWVPDTSVVGTSGTGTLDFSDPNNSQFIPTL